MKSKLARNGLIFATLCFLIGSCIFMSDNQTAALLDLISAFLCLIAAYKQHKKYKESIH
ncbi:hypothetical protein SH1V18_32840 [Vallitalea longa]|uniref:Lipoprotein n=1 Tax=Vallitalea longa TaxID=2936439 RepID=A0A9W5YF49_9FIRM|nr:hypothetical protein [Vallitalea longa]GKX30804.1 hypothetical protein SH1V18_32840 [Vallitalea longa]